MDNVIQPSYLDSQLRPLISAVTQALEMRGVVTMLSLWQPISVLALLPFSLHARWPDQVDRFPLSATMSYLPCSGADRTLLEVPLCTPEEAYKARVYARWCRNEAKTAHTDDFYLADWEEGYNRHRKDVGQRILGVNSYLAVDTVQLEGTIAHGSRPYLGRFVTRQAYRPSLLIPGRGALSEAALVTLASTDFAVVNLQRVRGIRTRNMLKEVLAARRRLSLPTLLVASSPNDLFALEDEEIERDVPVYTTEYIPALEQLHLATVGRDRLQLEQDFQFAVTELRGRSTTLDTVLDEIEQAWWIIRQSLDLSSARAAALPRLAHAQQYWSSVAPADADMLYSAQRLIERALGDEAGIRERLEQVLLCCDEHLKVPSATKTIVLVRGALEVEGLRQALHARWNTSDAELLSLGIEIKSVWSEPQPCDQLIGSSYFGSRTLDMIFLSRARKVTLLLDSVEARVAAFHLSRIHELLRRSASPQTLGVLTNMEPVFEEAMARTPEKLVHISLPAFLQKPLFERVSSLDIQPSATQSHDQMLISFTDGTTLLCVPTQLFDLLEAGGAGRLLQRAAAELEPGDELLVIEQEARASFSKRLMHLLNETVLHTEHARRKGWLLIVASTAQGRSRKQLQAGLLERGIHVNYATVRSWIPQIDDCENGTIPHRWPTFKALANELHITLPEEALRTYYDAARTWRVQHRAFGRRLTRLMRHAAFGQLDSETLRNVETQWGWRVRDLVQATRRCTVDDLVRITADIPLHLAG